MESNLNCQSRTKVTDKNIYDPVTKERQTTNDARSTATRNSGLPIRFTQDDNCYQSRLKNVRKNVSTVARSVNHSVSKTGLVGKPSQVMLNSFFIRSNVIPPIPRLLSPSIPNPRSSLSYQVQYRQQLCRKNSDSCPEKSISLRKPGSESGKSSEAVCTRDYDADADADDAGATGDEYDTDLELDADFCCKKDAQTQTLVKKIHDNLYQIGDTAGSLSVMKTSQILTTLFARRSLSDTSITRSTECSSQSQPSTSPTHFVSESTKVCRQENIYCHSLLKHDQLTEPEKEFKIPGSIKAILQPLEVQNVQRRKDTTTAGMAISLAACFLLFLGLLWTGISVSLATHKLVTSFLYPPPSTEYPWHLKKLAHYLTWFAHWLWYNIYY